MPDPTAGRPTPSPRHGRDRHEKNAWSSQDIFRAAVIVLAVYAGAQLLWFANQLFLVVFLGVLFGLAAGKVVDRMERKGLRRGIAAALVVLGIGVGLVGIAAWSWPTLNEQSAELREKLPEAIDQFDEYLEKHPDDLLSLILRVEHSDTMPATLPPELRDTVTRRDTITRGDTTTRRDTSGLRTIQVQSDSLPRIGAGPAPPPSHLRARISKGLTGARDYLFPFLTSTATIFGGMLIVMFLAIFVAADPDLYHRGLMHLFPHRSRERAGQVLSATSVALQQWLTAQLIAMLSIGVITSLALLLLGIPAAVPLGVIAGLLEFIPTIGPIISGIPAIMMGFVVSPEKAMYVFLVYLVIQQVEGNILIPLLMKEGVDLPPALTIVAQALMAWLFGIVGLLVAVPLLAAGMVMVKLLYVEDVVGDPIDLPGEDMRQA